MIAWKLDAVMRHYDIKGKELAEAMRLSEARISILRKKQELPVTGKKLSSLIHAINYVLKRKGNPQEITIRDLVEIN